MINIEHGVQVVDDDQLISEKDVSTIDIDLDPSTGMTLVHPDGTYVLDKLLQDNGVTRRHILRPLADDEV